MLKIKENVNVVTIVLLQSCCYNILKSKALSTIKNQKGLLYQRKW
jgi:hypothetical protein